MAYPVIRFRGAITMKIFAFILLMTSAAFAQSTPTANPVQQNGSVSPSETRGITAPVAPIGPQSCEQMYPLQAVRSNETGTTIVMAHISAQGTVSDAVATVSSSFDDLDTAALACVRQMTFRPAMWHGVNVGTPKMFFIRWDLAESTRPASLNLSVAPLPGWMPEFVASPGFVAAARTPAQQAGTFQTVSACACTYKGSLDAFIKNNLDTLQKSGTVLLGQKATTVCGGDTAWEVEYAQLTHIRGKPDLDLDAERVVVVHSGFAYIATYARPDGDPVKPDAVGWIHAFCMRVK
jgi:TonB family protein